LGTLPPPPPPLPDTRRTITLTALRLYALFATENSRIQQALNYIKKSKVKIAVDAVHQDCSNNKILSQPENCSAVEQPSTFNWGKFVISKSQKSQNM